MASIRKTKTGYRAEVCVNGVRDSGTFDTSREAKAWASMRETDLRNNSGNPSGNLRVSDLLDRYEREVSPSKRGARWETLRLRAMSELPIGSMRVCDGRSASISICRFDSVTVSPIFYLVVFPTIWPDVICHPTDYLSFLMPKYS